MKRWNTGKTRVLHGGRIAGNKDLKRFVNVLETLFHNGAEPIVNEWLHWFNHQCNHRGQLSAVVTAKSYYNRALRLISGQKVEDLAFTATCKDGWPKTLKGLKPYIFTPDRSRNRAVLSVLQLWRLKKVPSSFKKDTIVSPGLIPALSSTENTYVGHYFQRLYQANLISESESQRLRTCWMQAIEEAFPLKNQSGRLKELKKLGKLHISSKSGPNGPAVACAIVDYGAVISEDFASSIMELSTLSGNTKLTSLIKSLRDTPSFEGSIHSKISLKVEPGGKTRPFAICDWWSQSAMTGIHSWLFGWLAKQSEDGTFSHNTISNLMKGYTLQPLTQDTGWVSSDLTAATDRIPRDLQREILIHIFGSEVATHWTRILSERTFKFPDGSEGRFAVGQPLGILSSWASMAIWHHITVRTASKLANLDWRGGTYVVIGDDVAVRGSLRARSYQNLVSRYMGVDVSKEKSFDPFNPNSSVQSIVKSYHVAEIAKRVFIDGQEITPIPPEAILKGLRFASAFPELLRQATNRGWMIDSFEGPAPVLAKLSDKPNIAMLHSTFPCSPAPSYQGVTDIFKGLNVLTEDQNLGVDYRPTWWRFPYKDIEAIYTTLLRKRVVEAFKDTQLLVKEYKSLNKEPGDLKISRWIVSREALGLILSEIASQAAKRLQELFGGLLLKANVNYIAVKEDIGKNHALLELRLVLQGKTNFIDQKELSTNFFNKIQKETLERLIS